MCSTVEPWVRHLMATWGNPYQIIQKHQRIQFQESTQVQRFNVAVVCVVRKWSGRFWERFTVDFSRLDIKSKKNLWSWRKRTTLVYVGVQWIGCVQVRVQLTENWKMAHKETLLPLLLQLFLVPSVFLLIPIPSQNKSPGPERGISIISHAHEQQEHSWPPPSKAAADMCAPFVPVGNLSVTWSGIRGGWNYLSLSLQAPGHTSGMVWNFLGKKSSSSSELNTKALELISSSPFYECTECS